MDLTTKTTTIAVEKITRLDNLSIATGKDGSMVVSSTVSAVTVKDGVEEPDLKNVTSHIVNLDMEADIKMIDPVSDEETGTTYTTDQLAVMFYSLHRHIVEQEAAEAEAELANSLNITENNETSEADAQHYEANGDTE